MSHQERPFLLSAMLLLMLSSAVVAHQKCAQRSLKITGIIVAYDQLAALINITDAPQQQVLLVRVDKAVAGSRYLMVSYRYWGNDPALPDEVFDGKSKWQFKLARDCGCDGAVNQNQPKGENEIAVATWKETVEGEPLPFNARLPCYILRPKGLKPAGERALRARG